MSTKRPIDLQRESGGSIQLGGSSRGASEFYKIGEDHLLAVTSTAVHELKLPDQVDPQRTNPRLKPVQQRVRDYGTDDEFVCRILLTAKTLFREEALGSKFDHVRALALAFDGLKDVVAMRQLHRQLAKDQQAEWEAHQRVHATDSVHMPSVPDVRARCEMFLQKANHVVTCLEEIAKLFYGDELQSKWVDRLRELSAERYGSDHPLAHFMSARSQFLLFVMNARNCVEHRKAGRRVDVVDFTMDASGQISAPSIQVVHPDTPQAPITASNLMEQVTAGLVTSFEDMMAVLCAANLQPLPGLPIFIAEAPEDRRRHKNVRYGYFANIGGQIAPFG